MLEFTAQCKVIINFASIYSQFDYIIINNLDFNAHNMSILSVL